MYIYIYIYDLHLICNPWFSHPTSRKKVKYYELKLPNFFIANRSTVTNLSALHRLTTCIFKNALTREGLDLQKSCPFLCLKVCQSSESCSTIMPSPENYEVNQSKVPIKVKFDYLQHISPD